MLVAALSAEAQTLNAGSASAGAVRAAISQASTVKETMWGFLATGQSLSVGTSATSAGTDTHSSAFRNYMMGSLARAVTNRFTWMQAAEASSASGWKAFLDQVAWLCVTNSQPNHERLLLAWGVPGWEYAKLKKTSTTVHLLSTNLYTCAVWDATHQSQFFYEQHYRNMRWAVLVAHGETDGIQNNVTYNLDLGEWQGNLSADLIAAAYGTNDTIVPMFHMAPNWWVSATNILKAHRASSGESNIFVGARYHQQHSDGLHLTQSEYNRQGEYFAKAFFKRRVLDERYEPLHFTNSVLAATFVTNQYTGGTWPLMLDTTTVSNPGTNGFFWSDGSARTIIGVTLGGPQTNWVILELSGAPSGSKFVGYGQGGSSGDANGPSTGLRGNLRDSDPLRGYTTGSNLWQWAVLQREPVP